MVNQELFQGLASILMVSTLLSSAELVFYKKVVSVQIRKQIKDLMDKQSALTMALEKFTNIDILSWQQGSIPIVMQHEQKLKEIINTKLEKEEKDLLRKIFTEGPEEEDIDAIKSIMKEKLNKEERKLIEQKIREYSGQLDEYTEIIVNNEKDLNEKINRQTYTLGWFIVVAFAFSVLTMKGFLHPVKLSKGCINGALLTLLLLIAFQGYFYDLTSQKFLKSGSFSLIKGLGENAYLYPTNNAIIQNVIEYLRE